MGHVFRGTQEGLFVTLLLAAFSTVVVLLTELLDPATSLQHHHLGDRDDNSEEIWVLETLQKQGLVISRATALDTGSPSHNQASTLQDRAMSLHQGYQFAPTPHPWSVESATELIHLKIGGSPPTQCFQLFFLVLRG